MNIVKMDLLTCGLFIQEY